MARRSVPTGGNGKPSKNYGYLNHLDATGWYEEFYRIWNEFDVLKYPNAPKFRNIKAWSENGVRHHVRIIEKTIEVKTGVNTGLLVNRYRLPALVVYLDAPDKTIVKAVEKELLKRRERLGKNLIKQGRIAPNLNFDSAIFSKWIASQIIKLADLIIWNEKQKSEGQHGYSLAKLGQELEFDSSKTSRRKKLLFDVLKNLPALKAQIEN